MHTLSRVTLAALAVLVLDAAAARAAARPEPSLLALESPSVAAMLTSPVPPAAGPAAPETPVTLALAQVPGSVEFDGVHYYPRPRGGYRRHPESAGVSQLHAGFFDPDGPQTARFGMGIRGGPMVSENLQFGLGVDWIHKGEHVSSVTRDSIGAGGVQIEVKQDISRASVNMFPIMGFVQVSASDKLPLVPYVGAAACYEVLVLSGDDFITNQSFEGTFSGWGWQAWGGVSLPLDGRTRLTGEVYVNRAELGRDATDTFTGLTQHETVNADGVGMRFGVAWGF